MHLKTLIQKFRRAADALEELIADETPAAAAAILKGVKKKPRKFWMQTPAARKSGPMETSTPHEQS